MVYKNINIKVPIGIRNKFNALRIGRDTQEKTFIRLVKEATEKRVTK